MGCFSSKNGYLGGVIVNPLNPIEALKNPFQPMKTLVNGSDKPATDANGNLVRDPYNEASAMFQAQLDMAPKEFAAYKEFAPQYDAVDMERIRAALGADSGATIFDLNRQLTEAANEQTAASNRAMREADLRDVQQLGGQARDAARAANPELYWALNQLDYRANNGMPATEYETKIGEMAKEGYGTISGGNIANQSLGTATIGQNVDGVTEDRVEAPAQNLLGFVNEARALRAGPTGIEDALTSQAQQELALGTQLAPEEIRAAQQAARSAAASRGLSMNNASLAQEVLNTYQAGQDRLNQRRNFAAGANQLYRTGQEQDRGFGLNVQGQNLQRQGYGLQAALANQGANLQAQQYNASNQLTREQYNAGALNASNQAMFAQNMQAQLANSDNLYRQQMANNAFRQQQLADLSGANSMEQARRAQEFAQYQAAAQARLSTYQDPYMAILGRQSANVGSNTALYGAGQGVTGANNSIRNMFDPFNSYASDLYGSNQSAAYNMAIGSQNASAAKSAGAMQGGAAIAGSLIMVL